MAARTKNRAGEAARRQSGQYSTLSDKQEAFVHEYLKDMNAVAAAGRAGYSPRSIQKQGSQVLGNPRIQARIAELTAARNARATVDSDFVLKRLIDEVNADAADLYDASNRLKPVKEWPEVWRRGLVSTIRTTTLYGRGKDRGEEIGEQIDIVLVDRARRLELLGRHIKVNAFAADKLQIGLDSPLQELFKQISGNVIRPRQEEEAKLIEHEPNTTQDMRSKARKRPPGRDEDTQE